MSDVSAELQVAGQEYGRWDEVECTFSKNLTVQSEKSIGNNIIPQGLVNGSLCSSVFCFTAEDSWSR